MGFDMRTITTPFGEGRSAEEIRDQVRAAERSLNSASTLGLPYAFTPERAQELAGLLNDGRRRYFQLTVDGMTRYSNAMRELDMGYECAEPTDYPAKPDGRIGLIADAILEECDPRQFLPQGGTRVTERPMPTEDEMTAARAHVDQIGAFLRVHPDQNPGVPLFKLTGNSGWVVTAAECMEALAAWYRATEQEQNDALSAAGVHNRGNWQMWLDFLHVACFSEGFEVR